ncbi:alpha/beta fold hydrolase [Hyphococcus lacteus]|uniref:Alpha/beta fold hydrolase n=1 Tax=Hyphococcus lacteus TaxID=3143536 RepID=A0ABV3Z305_9PROT
MAVTPFHFGASERTMFGVYHHPEQRTPRAPAVLLCNPFGEEAIRSFRIFRVLAERLARAGSPVLRFDYFGTGDSAGECSEFSVAGMREDILTAHDELIDLSAKQRCVWAGLGLGASAAYLAALEVRPALAGLVMWDPAISGTDYLDMLLRSHVKMRAQFLEQDVAKVQARDFANPSQLGEALGFTLSPELKTEISAIDLLTASIPTARKLSIVGAGRDVQEDLACRIGDAGRSIDLHKEEDANSWNSDEALNAYMVPVKTLDKIVASIGGEQ